MRGAYIANDFIIIGQLYCLLVDFPREVMQSFYFLFEVVALTNQTLCMGEGDTRLF